MVSRPHLFCVLALFVWYDFPFFEIKVHEIFLKFRAKGKQTYQHRHGRRWFHVAAMFCALTKLAFNAPKDGRGIGQKQVLEQNLSSTDIQGCISVERYTDVQQLKMVQMLAQSPDFVIYIYSSDT